MTSQIVQVRKNTKFCTAIFEHGTIGTIDLNMVCKLKRTKLKIYTRLFGNFSEKRCFFEFGTIGTIETHFSKTFPHVNISLVLGSLSSLSSHSVIALLLFFLSFEKKKSKKIVICTKNAAKMQPHFWNMAEKQR